MSNPPLQSLDDAGLHTNLPTQVSSFIGREAELAEADVSFADVIKLNYYLTDSTMLPAVRVVRDEYVDIARPPASTAVQVTALALPGLLIEIEAWPICED